NGLEVPRLREALQAYPWDHRGLSHHFYHDPLKGHINMVSRRPENLSALEQIGPDKVLRDYFNGLIKGVEELDIDVLCHLDAVLRHYPGLTLRDEHWEMIEKLLDVLAANQVALEINTSGFPIKGEPFPQLRIIESALRKNVRLIAGSDAHKPDQVAGYFERLPEIFQTLLSKIK
ncbi:MAG: PHP domain-containing protein, partial [Desulfobulbaceae bacterium]|nr:PHP domain-containing protein [Desulfobulbaceae bacterium]